MEILLLTLAALAFSAGGLFMKLSAGLTRPWPTVTFVLLFVAGALVQAVAMRRSDLGVAYIFVLGLEAAITALLSAWMLHEAYPPQRLAAIGMVVIGILWLRST
jgi:multidrug transporter EmrE-like cation transporter